MTIKHEIKSQLAKLLATEDLVVEHRPVETAQFNVHTRVLTLPQWDNASNYVYDMLVGHEVGHALFTPDQDTPTDIPHSFVNIVEDARIEKLMKRKYLGLGKTFFRGYKELHEEDFFCLKDEDISKMNLADRANLWFKIGNHTQIPIKSNEEMEIINLISDTETFADVLVAAEALYKFCKEEKEKEKISDVHMTPQSEGGETEQPEMEQQPQVQSETTEGSSGEGQTEIPEIKEGENNKQDVEVDFDDEPKVTTAEKLEERLRDLVSNHGMDNLYVEIPKVNLDTVIAKNKDVHDAITKYFDYQISRRSDNGEELLFSKVDGEFKKFKKSAQKEVNYLVKEFECRKAADSYARANTARTGVLDCTKLHTYKYNEDLFKKVTTFADGKNHGLVFVLDWSGSMSGVLSDTCKQLFNLIWFCNKTGIPFDVYAFTNEWNRETFDYDKNEFIAAEFPSHYEKKENLLCVSEKFTMMNMLTSKTSTKELERQMINIWRIAQYYSRSWGTPYSIAEQLGLSGTPLNEALVTLHQIIPQFKSENKLQKVHCLVLTDGEANPLTRHVEIKREDTSWIGQRRLVPECTYVRDRKLGTTYMVDCRWHQFTDLLLKNLKENFPSVNFIGMRVLEGRDVNSFIRMYSDSLAHQKHIQSWKKLRSFCIKNSGYDAYFALSSSALSQDSDFEVDEGATKAKIKSAFIKSLKTKKLNKKVLGEFISLVV
jgi:hypothetical protein